jgi:hypothetical protein
MLRALPVLACLVFAAPGFAQDETNVVVFLKSPYYAKVEHSLTATGEKNIESSWCRPGANLAKFPWADEFALVGRGNNPMPLVHVIMADSDGRCAYFAVYTSMYSVLPDLGKSIAAWKPELSSVRMDESPVAAERSQTPAQAAPPPPLPALPVMQSEQQGRYGEQQAPLPRPKPQIIAVKKITTTPKPKEAAPSLTPAAANIPRIPIDRSIPSH